MVSIAQGEWIADLGAMVCRNINNGIVVCFEKSGKALLGKIKDMPMEVMQHWAMLKHGDRLIQNQSWKRKKFF